MKFALRRNQSEFSIIRFKESFHPNSNMHLHTWPLRIPGKVSFQMNRAKDSFSAYAIRQDGFSNKLQSFRCRRVALVLNNQ